MGELAAFFERLMFVEQPLRFRLPHPFPHRDELFRHQLGDRPVLTSAGVRWGWLGPLLIATLGGLLRFWHLDRPPKLAFDETYYVKEAASMLKVGYELVNDPELKSPSPSPDDLWNKGTTDVFGTSADFVVHPPLGKWMIAVGQLMYTPADITIRNFHFVGNSDKPGVCALPSSRQRTNAPCSGGRASCVVPAIAG